LEARRGVARRPASRFLPARVVSGFIFRESRIARRVLAGLAFSIVAGGSFPPKRSAMQRRVEGRTANNPATRSAVVQEIARVGRIASAKGAGSGGSQTGRGNSGEQRGGHEKASRNARTESVDQRISNDPLAIFLPFTYSSTR
jgi:hypothetical protein